MDPQHPAGASVPHHRRRHQSGRKRFLSLSIMATFVFGILFTGFFNIAMDWTNREEFCIACHEMKENVYREYQNSVHYSNRSGVRAVCADCHVPKKFFPKILRKLQASNEVWHKIQGTIDTPEKFEEKRAQLAQNEWRRMKANDSQECRSCHDPQSFDFSLQGYRSVNQHKEGLFSSGQTCIDCHKGIAHQLPQIDQGINQADPPGISLKIFRPPVPEKAPAPNKETAG